MPARQFRSTIVVKNVDEAPSKGQRVGSLKNAKSLKPNMKPHGVSTGDPLGPRRMIRSCKSSLFSITCELRTWLGLVETC